MTEPITSHGIGSKTQPTVSQKTFASGASHPSSPILKFILTDNLDGAEIHEENEEREEGSSQAPTPTQTTDTQGTLDSLAEGQAHAHAHARRPGREAHSDRCLYSPRNCAGSLRSDFS
jgi:hypothetical protein